jgi:hypothetical protein
MPVTHYHIGSICVGYAMARAFGKDANDASCDAATANPYDTRLVTKGTIDPTYFTFSTNYEDLLERDILVFDPDGNLYGHAAYVSDPGTGPYNPNQIYVDEVQGFGGYPQKHVLLRDVLTRIGVSSPAGRFRRIAHWRTRVSNSFKGGFQGGMIGYASPEITYRDVPSGYGESGLHYGGEIRVNAIEDGTDKGIYKQYLLRWRFPSSLSSLPSQKDVTRRSGGSKMTKGCILPSSMVDSTSCSPRR